MSEQETVQLGSLELRKAANGWQYLSEGAGGDPDQWCNASSTSGPLAGSGIDSLLDELAATKRRASSLLEQVITLKSLVVDIGADNAVLNLNDSLVERMDAAMLVSHD